MVFPEKKTYINLLNNKSSWCLDQLNIECYWVNETGKVIKVEFKKNAQCT